MRDPVKERLKYARQSILPILTAMILGEYGKYHKLLSENDNTIQTDIKADNTAIEKVLAKYPDDSIITEESSKRGEEFKGNEYKWIMDLLDGSSNYRKNISFFATSIAMQKNNELYGGLIYNPAEKQLFCARKDLGAFYHDLDKRKSSRLSVSDIDDLRKANISTVSSNSYKKYGMLGLLNDLQKSVKGNRQLGCTSLELAYTAKGAFDGIVKPTNNPWGVSAGLLMVEEAGGRITLFRKGNLNIYVASNPYIHKGLCDVVDNYLSK